MVDHSSHKVNLAIVSDSIYPYNKGGKEVRLYELSKRLAKRGFDVHIYTMHWWSSSNKILKTNDNITLHAICKKYPLYTATSETINHSVIPNIVRDLSTRLRMLFSHSREIPRSTRNDSKVKLVYAKNRRSIKEGIIFGISCFKLLFAKFDILDADSMPYFPLYSLYFVCLLKRKKFVAVWHEVWSREYWQEYLGRIKGEIAFQIEKIASMFPDTIISVSKLTQKSIISVYGRTKKVVYLPNGIDLEEMAKARPSKEKFDLIFAGRLLSHKNIDVLLNAVKILIGKEPNIKVAIIGDGPEKKALQVLSKSLKLSNNVQFFDFLSNRSLLYGYLKSAKVFVLPSTREGFGLAVLEANACGRPVVTIDYPDNAAKDLIQKGANGLLCSLNPNELAKTTANVLLLSEKPKTAKICQELAKKYEWSTIANKLSDLYTES